MNHREKSVLKKLSFIEKKGKKFIVDDDTIIRNQRGDEIIFDANTREEQ